VEFEELGAIAGFVMIVATIVGNLGLFVWRRRCPKCKRWFVGKKVGAYTTNYSKSSGRRWDYSKNRYQRETRTSGTTHVSLKCRKCEHSWGYTSRWSRTTKP